MKGVGAKPKVEVVHPSHESINQRNHCDCLHPLSIRAAMTRATTAMRGVRQLSTSTSTRPYISRRAMLYVPGSNPRMLEKSLSSPADSVCYDLEDAVAPAKKPDARRAVYELLNVSLWYGVEKAVWSRARS